MEGVIPQEWRVYSSINSVEHNSIQNEPSCGAYFVMKCMNKPKWCHLGNPWILANIIIFYPPNYALLNDNGSQCNHPHLHFNLLIPIFHKMDRCWVNSYKNCCFYPNTSIRHLHHRDALDEANSKLPKIPSSTRSKSLEDISNDGKYV